MARQRIHEKKTNLTFAKTRVEVRQMSGVQTSRIITAYDLESALFGTHFTGKGYADDEDENIEIEEKEVSNLEGKEWGRLKERKSVLDNFNQTMRNIPVGLTVHGKKDETYGGYLFSLPGKSGNEEWANNKSNAQLQIMFYLMGKKPSMGKKKASMKTIVYKNLQSVKNRIDEISANIDNLNDFVSL